MAGAPHSPLLCACLRRRIDHSASNLSLSVCTQTHTQTHTHTYMDTHKLSHRHPYAYTLTSKHMHTHRPSLASIPSLSASFCCLKRFMGKQVACGGRGELCWSGSLFFPHVGSHFKSVIVPFLTFYHTPYALLII